jgi:hypothetical protein
MMDKSNNSHLMDSSHVLKSEILFLLFSLMWWGEKCIEFVSYDQEANTRNWIFDQQSFFRKLIEKEAFVYGRFVVVFCS